MKQEAEKTIEEFLSEMTDKITLRGKDIKTDYMSFHGKRGHAIRAVKYGMKKRHPWKGAA